MRKMISTISLLVVIFLAGCGGGSGDRGIAVSTANLTGLKIQGSALVPSSSELARSSSRSANSATGLVSVKTGIAVGVYFINDNGSLSSSSLATSRIKDNGSFDIELPSNITTITSNMVVVIQSGSEVMRSFVTSTTVLEVSPVSEYVVTQVVSSDIAISSYSVAQLTTIQTQVLSSVQSQNINFSSYTSVTTAVQGLGNNTVIQTTIEQSIDVVVTALGVVASISPTSGYTTQTYTLTCTVSGGTATTLEGRCSTSLSWSSISSGNTMSCTYDQAGTYTPGCRVNLTNSDNVDTVVTVADPIQISVNASVSPLAGTTADEFNLTCIVSGGTATTLEGRCSTDLSWAVIATGNTMSCTYSSAGSYTPECKVNSTNTDSIDSPISVFAVSATGCSSSALSYVETAKTKLDQYTITESDFSAAVSALNSALADSPLCPDALILSSFTDIGQEADRLGRNVLEDPLSIFPLVIKEDASPIGVATRPIGAILSNGAFKFVPRVSNKLTEESLPYELQDELENGSMDVFEATITKLENALSVIDSSWTMGILKDISNPSLGYDYFDINDIKILNGSLKIAVGFLYYGLAYDLTLPQGYENDDPCPETVCSVQYVSNSYTQVCQIDTSYEMMASRMNTCSEADLNNDQIITPEEYFPPAPYGTLRTGGDNYMAIAKSHVSQGFSDLYEAVDGILSESEATIAGQSIIDDYISDTENYKHYISDIADSFSGISTIINIPKRFDCWTLSWGTYYTHNVYLDVSYENTNLDECLSTVLVTEEINVNINFGMLFEIDDVRNVMPNAGVKGIDGKTLIDDSFENSTLGGILPDGFVYDMFDKKIPNIGLYDMNFVLPDGEVIEPDPSEIHLYQDGTEYIALNAGIWGSNYYCNYGENNYYTSLPSGGNNYISLPSGDNYITVNNSFGKQSYIRIPGYQDVPISLYSDREFLDTITLIPN